MVANLVVVALPGVQVQMLILGAPAGRGADKHVVKGLAVHVEQVRVALGGGHVGHVVEIQQPGALQEDLDGLDLGELVEVACGDDGGSGALLEDLGDEVLYGSLVWRIFRAKGFIIRA